MKKIFMFVMATIAMSFAACGGKTASTSEPDSLAQECVSEEVAPTEQANAVVALLQEQLQNADPEQVKAISAQIAEKISEFIAAGDTAAAQTYTAVINNFIVENAAQLQNTDIVSTVTEAISNVENIPSSFLQNVQSAATGVANDANAQAAALQQSAENVKAAVEAAPEAAKEAAKAKATEVVNAAQQKAQESAAAAEQKAKSSANKAIDDAAASAKKSLGL